MRIRFRHSMILACLLIPVSSWAGSTNHTVTVGGSGLTFSPSSLSIAAGDTVTFVNAGGFHNATTNPGAVTSFRCANGCDATGGNGAPSSAAWSGLVTFPTPGTASYFCEVHGQIMSGVINVTVPVSLQTFEVD
jgi:plastocyanin